MVGESSRNPIFDSEKDKNYIIQWHDHLDPQDVIRDHLYETVRMADDSDCTLTAQLIK